MGGTTTFSKRWLAPIALMLALLAAFLGARPAQAQLSLADANNARAATRDSGSLSLPSPISGEAATQGRGEASRTADDFDLPGEAVRDRRRPDYDPVGIRMGAFTILPTAGVGAGYDSNSLSQASGRSDTHGLITGGSAIRSNWSAHQLNFDLGAATREYAGGTRAGGTGFRIAADGKVEVARGYGLHAEASREHIITDRSAIEENLITNYPVKYDRTAAEIRGRVDRGRFVGDLSVGWAEYDYKNTKSSTGREIDLQYRDFSQRRFGIDIGYHLGTKDVFVAFQTDRRRHRLDAPVLRDSNGIEALVGVRGAITPLIRGQLALSYMSIDFKDPRVRTRNGLGLDAELQYLLTELTTINFAARRSLRNAANANSPAAFTTRFSLGADHELRRNVILSAGVSREQADYVASSQESRITRATVGATWLINRQFSAGADIGYRWREDKNFPVGRDHSGVTFGVSLKWRL